MLDLGMYEDAQQTYRQVARIYRACIQEGSPASEIDARVARAIIGLCAALQRLGKAEEALNLIKEAVLIFRFLNEQSSLHHYKAELAIVLNNMANYMQDSGEIAVALPTIDEVVNIRQELARMKPDLYKPDLVVSLLNASTCYSELPYFHEQALNLAEKAVDISRELVLEVPGKHAAHLGATLHNRANRRMVLWRHQDAYLDIQEAVEIRRKLASSRPDVFGGGLIRSLSVAKALAIRCKDETGANALSEELRRWCKHTPGSDDIPMIRSPVIPVGFNNPHYEFGLRRYAPRRKIRYHGSGNLATPHVLDTPNTSIDQVISPRPAPQARWR